jgi:hypothetical protein
MVVAEAGSDAGGNSRSCSDKSTCPSLDLSCLEPIWWGNDGDFDNMMILLDQSHEKFEQHLKKHRKNEHFL